MLRKLILKLRRQPKAVKENISLVAAGIVTFSIFTVWAYHLPARLSDDNGQVVKSETKTFSEMLNNATEQVAAVREALPEKEILKESLEAEMATTSASHINASSTQSNSNIAAPKPVTSSTSTSGYSSDPTPIRVVTFNKASSSATSSTE